MGFCQEMLDDLAVHLTAAKERSKMLKTEADAAAHFTKVLEDLHSYMIKNWPLHILNLLDQESTLLEAHTAHKHLDPEFIEEVNRQARQQADKVKKRYPSYLEEACRLAGLILDPESAHPIYSLDQRFFQLRVDEQKWVARLSNHEGQLCELPADIDAVVGTLLSERKRIFDRPFNGPKFLKLLRSQYLAVAKKEKKADGASIPIRHITRRLGKNVKGFRTDEFLIDLSRLVEQGPLEIDGYRLDLQQTKDTKQGMLLQGSAGRGYIGFLVFRRV